LSFFITAVGLGRRILIDKVTFVSREDMQVVVVSHRLVGIVGLRLEQILSE
jgi:hypothetical protein